MSRLNERSERKEGGNGERMGSGRRWGGGKNEKREEKEIEKQEGGSAVALKRMLCLAVSLSFLFLCSDCNAHVFFFLPAL